MAGRWNFGEAFARSLANQQKLAMESEQGAREQQRIDLQTTQVDQEHSHQLAQEENAREETRRRILFEGAQATREEAQLSAANRVAKAAEERQQLEKNKFDLDTAPMSQNEAARLFPGMIKPGSGVNTYDKWKDAATLAERQQSMSAAYGKLSIEEKRQADLKAQTGIVAELQRQLRLNRVGEDIVDHGPATQREKRAFVGQFAPDRPLAKRVDEPKDTGIPLRERRESWKVKNENLLAPLFKEGGVLDNMKKITAYARVSGTSDDNVQAGLDDATTFIRSLRDQVRGKVRDPFISLFDDYEGELLGASSGKDAKAKQAIDLLLGKGEVKYNEWQKQQEYKAQNK